MINPSLGALGLSSEELNKIPKLLAEERGITGYKSMSADELLSAIIPSKPVKKVKNQNKIFLKQK